MYIEEKSISR